MDRTIIPLVGQAGDKHWIYRLGEEGLTVRETVIDTGFGGEAVEILHLSDFHVSFGEERRQNLANALVFGKDSDFIVATGDMLDGIHEDLLAYYRETFAPYPHSLFCLGNHEWAGVGEGFPPTADERTEALQAYWPHDVYYASRLVKDRVLLIQMDNSQAKFWDSQVPLFAADLALAREKGYTVLVFYHVPLNTANPDETAVPELVGYDGVEHLYNFCDWYKRGTPDNAEGKILDLIMHNADVIRGTFCGHFHADIYTEFAAKTASGEDARIPQYIGHAGCYDYGYVHKVTVK